MTNLFDERARDWDSDPGKIERARRVAEAMRARLPLSKKMSALEYGCGTGLLSFALQEDLGNITLADSSDGMLQVLGEKIAAAGLHHLTPLKLDLMTDPLPKNRFDLVYSLMTLHHVSDTARLLADFFSLLRSPGWLAVADLDREDGSFHGADVQVHHGFERRELGRMLEKVGFSQIHFETAAQLKRGDGEFPVFLAVGEKR